MAITTKTELAGELGITPSRVSQYVKAGLPVLASGKLDREQALKWITQNCVALNPEDRGATRALRLVNPPRKRAEPEASSLYMTLPDAALAVLAEAIAVAGAAAATAALHAGQTVRLAYTLDGLVGMAVWEAIDRALGTPRDDREFEAVISDRLMAAELDWEALAAKRGEPCDLDEWCAATGKLAIPFSIKEPAHAAA